MNKHILILALVAVAVLLTAGCRRLDPLGQTSDLELVLSTEEPETKATLTIPATLQTGGKFNNLLVVLATGNATDGYTVQYVDQRDYASAVKTGTALFRNVKNRNGSSLITYQVFAFANLNLEGDFWADKSWEEIAQELTDESNVLSENGGKLILNGDNTAVVASGVASLLTTVEADKGAMLLTGRGKVTVNGNTVKVNGSTSGKISLKRPFVRLTVTVQNPTGRPVKLDQLSFSAFKTAKTYLFERLTNGVPVIPAPDDPDDAVYEEFAVTSLPETPWTGNKTVYTTYLFENEADEDYKMYGHVIMYTPGTNPLTEENDLYLGLGDAPRGNGSVLQKLVNQIPEQITYMNRNQALDIIMNIYYGSSTGDFTFELTSECEWISGVGGSHTFQ